MTDWSKVMEIFGSGIVGVHLVMIMLMLLLMLSTKVIDHIERLQSEAGGKKKDSETNSQAGPEKEQIG